MAQMTTTPDVPPIPTTTSPMRSADELDLIMRDLATTGRSCAADRAVRLAYAALDAQKAAFAESQRIAREARKLETAQRRQAKREATAEARHRFWAARR